MAVQSTVNKHTYQGNGSTTEWPFTFEIFEPEHLKVYLTDAAGTISLLTAGYTVEEGQIKYPSAGDPLPTGWKITLLREVPLTQETDLTIGGGFAPEVLEAGYDKLTMITQQLSEKIRRSVQLPVDSPAGAGDELLSTILNSTTQAVQSAQGAAASAGTAQSAQQAASSSASSASSSAAAATLAASIAQSSVAGIGSDSITSAPVTGLKTITATAASLFAGASRLVNRSKVTVRNDDPSIRIRVGPSGVTQQSGFPVEPGGFAEFLINRAQSVEIYAISEGAAVLAEVWES